MLIQTQSQYPVKRLVSFSLSILIFPPFLSTHESNLLADGQLHIWEQCQHRAGKHSPHPLPPYTVLHRFSSGWNLWHHHVLGWVTQTIILHLLVLIAHASLLPCYSWQSLQLPLLAAPHADYCPYAQPQHFGLLPRLVFRVQVGSGDARASSDQDHTPHQRSVQFLYLSPIFAFVPSHSSHFALFQMCCSLTMILPGWFFTPLSFSKLLLPPVLYEYKVIYAACTCTSSVSFQDWWGSFDQEKSSIAWTERFHSKWENLSAECSYLQD